MTSPEPMAPTESAADPGRCRVRVHDGEQWHELEALRGTNLRTLLLEHDLSPYTALTRLLNCGGRGLCATCGVRFEGEVPAPKHWHDCAAARYGYPRLSCQITVDGDLDVRLLPEKRVWGGRE